MPLKRVPYRSLRVLLRRELVSEEHPPTAALLRRLAPIKTRGRFTRAEFLLMCRWKSPRARRHYERNTAARIRRASIAALAARDGREGIGDEGADTLAATLVDRVSSGGAPLHFNPRYSGKLTCRICY